MAKKKVAKKATSNIAMKPAASCEIGDCCYCKAILAIIVIALTWWKPAVMWSQIVITIAAAIILISGNSCYCKKK
jgi:hypothetical protein